MIIYSVTISIEAALRANWLGWMEEVHIPDVMATGCFQSYSLQELVEPKPQEGAYTFNIQYLCESLEEYERYQKDFAPALQAEHTKRYKDRAVGFRTLLRRIT
ncbi:MAG: DUF4286 family protein [Bacteroidia bacterium]